MSGAGMLAVVEGRSIRILDRQGFVGLAEED
jgi:hypothetical protein